MSLAQIYAVIFLIVSIISFTFGALSRTARKTNASKNAFLIMSICLGLWALGFAMAISAPTRDTCLLWRRVSAVGWGTIYAAVLHLALILNGFHRKKYFNIILALIYAPALVIVYIFGLSNEMAAIQYNFIASPAGWTNQAVNNGWDFFFYSYMAVYVVSSLTLYWRNWRSATDVNEKKQARALLTAFEASVLLGTLTDLINSSVHLLTIPQVAPILILIPLYAFYYNIRKLNFLNINIRKEERIITEDVQTKLLLAFAATFTISGLLNFLTRFFRENMDRAIVLTVTVIFIGCGLSLFLFRKHILKKQWVESLFTVSFVVFIPAITMLDITHASLSVWAFPVVCVLFSLLFNNNRLLVTTSISIILTQLLVWVNYPQDTVSINAADFVTRLSIFVVAVIVARYVNSVYIRRLRENAENNRYRQLISDSSAMLSSSHADTVITLEDRIQKLLAECARCFGANAAIMRLYHPADRTLTGNYFWRAGDNFMPPGHDCDDLCDVLIKDDIVLCDIDKAPADTKAMFAPLHDISARAFLSTPLPKTDRNTGFLGIIVSETPVNWTQVQIDSLRILSKSVSDALLKIAAEQEIKFMAYHDFLTRLPNRMLFIDRTEQAINLARRTEKQIGVMFLDLDAFKSINDTMGHRVGDELIRAVASKLAACVRTSDTVSRYGGDEFLIMLNNMTKRADFERVADAIMGLFKEPFYLQGQEIFITASAGIAVYPFDGDDSETLIKNADIAMYNAKEDGKNHYMFSSEDMREDVMQKVKLTNNLYRALERHELRVYYQPQVSVQTQQIVGAEALLRWFHPELGLISPVVFIPIAEKTGLIGAIGHWVLNEACKQLKDWQDKGLTDMRMAVNISVNQLRNTAFVEQVQSVLEEQALDPQYLELEVTESAVIKEADYIIGVLEKLKKLGIYLSIDDFGTEYSSLSRLKKLPVDRIKMDMQFVKGLDSNEKDQAISKGIINLAKSLNMNVIAEGVETQGQLSFLSERLCDEVQGFYFYKPMPAKELEHILFSSRNNTGPALN